MKVTDKYCPNGHEVTKALVYYQPSTGNCECVLCRRERSRERNRRVRAAAKLALVPPPPPLPPLGSKLRWDDLDDAPLGVTPLEVCYVG